MKKIFKTILFYKWHNRKSALTVVFRFSIRRCYVCVPYYSACQISKSKRCTLMRMPTRTILSGVIYLLIILNSLRQLFE